MQQLNVNKLQLLWIVSGLATLLEERKNEMSEKKREQIKDYFEKLVVLYDEPEITKQ